jgi:sigma-B regulation protein RsbU (phosphoserine phosphatase)
MSVALLTTLDRLAGEIQAQFAAPFAAPLATDRVLASPMATIAPLQHQLSHVLAEVEALRTEVDSLRTRDRAINFHMQRLDDELRLAARLQQDFLPKSLPQLGNVRFHTLFRPAGYVSGDLYDVMRLDEKHVGFYMADAVGHGMPAALLTMFIKNALVTKQIGADGYRLLAPGETMAKLNDALVGQKLSHATFATALYGLINTETGDVSFARGGHPNPIILRADGTVEMPQVEGCLLGIFEDERYPDRAFKLSAGDRLFLFTDGIEVVFTGAKIIDAQQWAEELQRRRHMTTPAILEHFSNQIEHSAGSLEPKDDLTIIVVEMQEK